MSEVKPPVVVHERLDENAKRFSLSMAGLALVIALIALVLDLRRPEAPVFISVSMKSLVEEHMLSTVGLDITAYEAELRTQEYARALNLAVGEIAGERQVIVLAAEAVIGANVPDFTEDIRNRTHAIAREMAARRGEALPDLGDTSAIDRRFEEMRAQTDALSDELSRMNGTLPEETPR